MFKLIAENTNFLKFLTQISLITSTILFWLVKTLLKVNQNNVPGGLNVHAANKYGGTGSETK